MCNGQRNVKMREDHYKGEGHEGYRGRKSKLMSQKGNFAHTPKEESCDALS